MAQVASIPRPSSRSSIRSPSPPSATRPPSSSSLNADSPPSTFSQPEPVTPLSASKDSSIDSLIPLPVRSPPLVAEAIPEGVPLDVSAKVPPTPNSDGRPLTPSRTLSRIPISAVGNARALTDEGRTQSISPLPPFSASTTPAETSQESGSAPPSSTAPTTPSVNGFKRLSIGAGGTSKVLSDLQTAAVHARNALDNTRQQLRLSQRSVAQLTRQVEDLKDGRERLRLENESLNNVVTRKERLLQELLERARKAEAEVVSLKTQLKAETTNAKKSVATVNEAVTQSQKAQREYTILRDSVSGLTQSWKNEVKELKDEMRKRDDAWREEIKEVTVKYNSLVKLIKATSAERSRIESIKSESSALDKKFEAAMRDEVKALAEQIHKSTQETEEAGKQANELAVELARLRRLMRTGGATKLQEEMKNSPL
ncbi:hypothetical protein FRB99_002756 [Tulasnella sp. 403]|nr:hypothetical protein FRB99_002756 [Tulasnella sp. 403]